MKTSDISVAEKIVDANYKLTWDGWNIVHTVPDGSVEYHKSGRYSRALGKWSKQTVYTCLKDGWDIPDSVIIK